MDLSSTTYTIPTNCSLYASTVTMAKVGTFAITVIAYVYIRHSTKAPSKVKGENNLRDAVGEVKQLLKKPRAVKRGDTFLPVW